MGTLCWPKMDIRSKLASDSHVCVGQIGVLRQYEYSLVASQMTGKSLTSHKRTCINRTIRQ